MYKEAGTARFLPQPGKPDAVRQIDVATPFFTGVLMSVLALAAAKLSLALFVEIWIVAGVMAAYLYVARDTAALLGLNENKAAVKDRYARLGSAN